MGSFAENIAKEVRKLTQKGIGATFWLQTTVFSDAISLTPSTMNLTANSQFGDLAIEDIIVRGHTGGGLSGGGTFRIICTNNFGSSVVFAAKVVNLGTSANLNMRAARDLNQTGEAFNNPTILEEGKKLQVQNSDLAGAGDGKVDIRIKFRILSEGATIEV